MTDDEPALFNYDMSNVPETLISRDISGGPQLALMLGYIFIGYAFIDFGSWLVFGILYPGGSFTPLIFSAIGGSLIQYKDAFESLNLENVRQSRKTLSIFVVVFVFCSIMISSVMISVLTPPDIVGSWTNEVQSLSFDDRGQVEDSEEVWIEYRVHRGDLFLVANGEEEYEYLFIYEISGDILFIAPYTDDGNIDTESCSAYADENIGWGNGLYDYIPSWCSVE